MLGMVVSWECGGWVGRVRSGVGVGWWLEEDMDECESCLHI